MAIDVVPCGSRDDFAAALGPIMHYFGSQPVSEDLDRWSRTMELPRMFAAREGGAVVGGAGAFSFELTVPGGLLPAAGVSVVGVLPTHRRRGVLSAMMRAQLDDVHARGEAVAYLWASEATIYGRFGYGMASFAGEVDIPRSANAFVRPVARRLTSRLVGPAEALDAFPRVYERVRPAHPGMFARSRDWWEVRRLADPENRRMGGGVLNRLLLVDRDEPVAYALYRMHQSLDSGVTTGFVNVIEAVGADDAATGELWRVLLDLDWTSRLKAAFLPVDHPLYLLVAQPRHLRLRLTDALWVRLVDVAAALGARALGAGEPVVIDVLDAFCPWNAGRWAVGEGGAMRTDREAELTLDVRALGSVYLGGFTIRELARAGFVEERRPGAIARADRILARGERAPWCPEIF